MPDTTMISKQCEININDMLFGMVLTHNSHAEQAAEAHYALIYAFHKFTAVEHCLKLVPVHVFGVYDLGGL